MTKIPNNIRRAIKILWRISPESSITKISKIYDLIDAKQPNYVLYGGVLYKPPIWVFIQSVGCISTYIQIIRSP